MKPPIRLIDDERFSASLRADLRDAKATPPVDYDEHAGLERFTALVAVPAVGVAAVAATKAAAASATALTAPAATVSAVAVGGAKAAIGAKLVIGFVAAASVIGGSVYLATRPASVPAPVASSQPVAVVAPTAAPKPIETVADVSPPAPIEAPRPSAKPVVAPSASAETKPSVKAEMAQYAEIRAASGDPARALALANEGHAKFPRGVFWQEREIIAIQSLQRLGRADEAKRRSDVFVKAHPESVYAETLKGTTP